MADASKVYLATDLGASSGRVVAGRFDGRRLELGEVHRFANGPVVANGRMYWDLLQLWQQQLDGLRAAAAQFGQRVASVGVDSWGVDFALLGPGDELLGNPYHYRDRRTVGMMARACARVPREEIFAETGVQFMELNTLYQLLALQAHNPALLDVAESFLMIPDLIHWLLTGEKANELTNASTTQLFNPRAQAWSRALLDRFALPGGMFGDIVRPGTRLGKLRASIGDDVGLAGVEVVVPGTHDTASAVMGVPAAGPAGDKPEWCYISSGTWSLMGVETRAPIINDTCRALNFTNEGGVGGTTRVLKNIAGLWILQECRRCWEQAGQSWSWDALVEQARTAAPWTSLIDPDAAEFVAPGNMPDAIREFCRRSGQPIPEGAGQVVRCVLESLALRYRMVLAWLEALTGSRLGTIHVVGGGTRNQLLCQMTADACDRSVVAGPVEATAIGNLMMQAVAAGDVASIRDARAVIRESFPLAEYTPHEPEAWHEAHQRFQALCGDGRAAQENS